MRKSNLAERGLSEEEMAEIERKRTERRERRTGGDEDGEKPEQTQHSNFNKEL